MWVFRYLTGTDDDAPESTWMLILTHMPVGAALFTAFLVGQCCRHAIAAAIQYYRLSEEQRREEEQVGFLLPLLSLGTTVQQITWWQEGVGDVDMHRKQAGHARFVASHYEDIHLCELDRVCSTKAPKLHAIQDVTADPKLVKDDMMAIREYVMDNFTRKQYLYFMIGKELHVYTCTKYMLRQLKKAKPNSREKGIRANAQKSKSNIKESFEELGYDELTINRLFDQVRDVEPDHDFWPAVIDTLRHREGP